MLKAFGQRKVGKGAPLGELPSQICKRGGGPSKRRYAILSLSLYMWTRGSLSLSLTWPKWSQSLSKGGLVFSPAFKALLASLGEAKILFPHKHEAYWSDPEIIILRGTLL